MVTDNFRKLLLGPLIGHLKYIIPITTMNTNQPVWYAGDTSKYISLTSDYSSNGIYSAFLGAFLKSKPTGSGSANAYRGVCFGDGDTPPTPADLNISGNAFSTYDALYNLSTGVDDSGHLYVKAHYTITNTGNEAFTIKEIGLFAAPSLNKGPDIAVAGSFSILLDRTVLDTPVTIPAGGIGQVEYTITFNLPTAAADAEETE